MSLVTPRPTAPGDIWHYLETFLVANWVEMTGRDCYWPEMLLKTFCNACLAAQDKELSSPNVSSIGLGTCAPVVAQSFPASFAPPQPLGLPWDQKVCSGHALPRMLSPGVQPLHRHSQAGSSLGHQYGHGDIWGTLILEWISCGVHDSVLSPWGFLNSKICAY